MYSRKYENRVVYMPKGISVKEFAFAEEVNEVFRPEMEDDYFIYDNVLNDGSSCLFGLFDGHGGKEVVNYLKANFQKEFLAEYKKNPRDVAKVFDVVFRALDDQLLATGRSQNMGSTACVGFFRMEESKRVLYCANVGDSRCLLLQDTTSRRLTYDHRGTDPTEQMRIKRGGGAVFNGRVSGFLAVTRAFGDHSLKTAGVIVNPHVEKADLRLIDKCVVVASDGVWDNLSDLVVADIVRSRGTGTTEEIARAIVKEAIAQGSKDNTSVLVIRPKN